MIKPVLNFRKLVSIAPGILISRASVCSVGPRSLCSAPLLKIHLIDDSNPIAPTIVSMDCYYVIGRDVTCFDGSQLLHGYEVNQFF
jgi:hypothetical protein